MNDIPRHAARVTLRRLAATDLADFQAYRHDPVVGLYQGWTPQPDEAALAFITEMAAAPLLAPGAWVQLGVADRATDRLLGDVGLHLSADGGEAEVGITLSAGAQGRGLATEALRAAIALIFERTAARRVIGNVDTRNAPSIRLLERVGMRRLDTVDAVFRGAPCREHVYAIDREGDESR